MNQTHQVIGTCAAHISWYLRSRDSEVECKYLTSLLPRVSPTIVFRGVQFVSWDFFRLPCCLQSTLRLLYKRIGFVMFVALNFVPWLLAILLSCPVSGKILLYCYSVHFCCRASAASMQARTSFEFGICSI